MNFIKAICFVLPIFTINLSLAIAKPVDKKQVCATGKHWVKGHPKKAYIRADGVQVSASYVSGHCRTNTVTYIRWIDRLKAGSPPGWRQKSEKEKPWTTEEKERVIEALSQLPDKLLLDSIKGIFRFSKSSQYGLNPASGQSGYIVLYDPAFDPQNNLARIISHELAHEAFRQFSGATKYKYSEIGEWLVRRTPKGEEVLIPNRDFYTEEDGKENIEEDFSNNTEYFLFNPEGLKAKAPKVYDWIRNQYGDNFKLRKEDSK